MFSLFNGFLIIVNPYSQTYSPRITISHTFCNFMQTTTTMGLVYADIELINGDDLALVRYKIKGEDEVKRMHVNMLVDTGSVYMCINENIQEQLQLPVLEQRKGQLANGHIVEYDVVGP